MATISNTPPTNQDIEKLKRHCAKLEIAARKMNSRIKQMDERLRNVQVQIETLSRQSR